MRNTIALVLGGGRGTRLYPLTKYRSKPAVPLAAKYRLIDIPLSNCINSGLNRIYVLTQFLSVSLHRHLRRTYTFDAFSGGFVELLAAQQTTDLGTDWYQGTADAVRKNSRYLEGGDIDHALILSGDQLYRMDYRDMMRSHCEAGADVTIAALPVSREAARSLGVMRVDESGRVVGFLEKPQTDDEIDLVRTDPSWIDALGMPSHGRECLASMGIYLFNRDFLLDVLTKTAYEDFGKEVFPAAFRARHVHAHLFDGYWEDIGTIKAFYDANLSLAGDQPPFEFHCQEAPIYTRARFLPPTRVGQCSIKGSLIADGCRIGNGAVIENSVIGLRCVIDEGVTIRDSVIMGADYYNAASANGAVSDHGAAAKGSAGIGRGSVIEGAILDKNCCIGRNVTITNSANLIQSEDAADCIIRERIPIVLKGAKIEAGFRI